MTLDMNELIKEVMAVGKVLPTQYAAIYARRSIKLENNSLKTQIANGNDTLLENNLLLYDVYKDVESATRYTPLHRPGFKRLMTDAMNNKFKTVIVFKRDRLARKEEHFYEIIEDFNSLGIKIIYSSKGEFQSDGTPESMLIEGLLVSMDALEPQVTADRTRQGKLKKLQNNEFWCGGTPTLGFKRDMSKKPTTYFPDDTIINGKRKSALIKEIFSKYLSGESLKSIVSYIKNFLGKGTMNQDKLLEKVLLNPLYCGLRLTETCNSIYDSVVTIPNTEEITISRDKFKNWNNVIPIINEKDWFNVLLSSYKREQFLSTHPKFHTYHPFHKIMYCNECKSKVYKTDEGYYCQHCKYILDSNDVDKKIITNILKKVITDNSLTEVQEKKLKRLKTQIESYERKKNKLNSKNDKLLVELLSPSNINNKKDFLDSILNNENLMKSLYADIKSNTSIDAEKQKIYKLEFLIDKLQAIKADKDFSTLVNLVLYYIDNFTELFPELISKIYLSKPDSFSLNSSVVKLNNNYSAIINYNYNVY